MNNMMMQKMMMNMMKEMNNMGSGRNRRSRDYDNESRGRDRYRGRDDKSRSQPKVEDVEIDTPPSRFHRATWVLVLRDLPQMPAIISCLILQRANQASNNEV